MADNRTSSWGIAEDQNFTSSLPDGLTLNLSSQCLLQLKEQLECYPRHTPDNISELICEPQDGDSGAETARTHAVFLLVAAVTIVLTIVLNLTVLLTIYFSKKLHTIVNYLVSLLCVNQLPWAVIPLFEVYELPILVPRFCTTRSILFMLTGTLNFALIVTITLLRYLLVVKNHSYPTNWQNVLLFTMIPVFQSVTKTVLGVVFLTIRCSSFFGRTSAGYVIAIETRKTEHAELQFLMITEYVAGFAILLFCYIKILIKVIASRRRVISNPQRCQTTVSYCVPIANPVRRISSWFTERLRSRQLTTGEQPAPAPVIPLSEVHHSTINQESMSDTGATGQHPENDASATGQPANDMTTTVRQHSDNDTADIRQPGNDMATTARQHSENDTADIRQPGNDTADIGQPANDMATTARQHSANDTGDIRQPGNDASATGQPGNDMTTTARQHSENDTADIRQPGNDASATGQPANDASATGQPANDMRDTQTTSIRAPDNQPRGRSHNSRQPTTASCSGVL